MKEGLILFKNVALLQLESNQSLTQLHSSCLLIAGHVASTEAGLKWVPIFIILAVIDPCPVIVSVLILYTSKERALLFSSEF